MGKQKRVGILGGTFDPIHFGHLLAAEQAREQANLDEVWFMPARIPPHKQRKDISSEQHRLRMIELAIADHPGFRVTDIEFQRTGPSFTFDTMAQLMGQYPELSFSFIIGGDMIALLPEWYRIEELLQKVPFIGLLRPGSPIDSDRLPSGVQLVEMPLWELSSSLIREKVRLGRSLRYLVPDAVARYIKEQGLYEITVR